MSLLRPLFVTVIIVAICAMTRADSAADTRAELQNKINTLQVKVASLQDDAANVQAMQTQQIDRLFKDAAAHSRLINLAAPGTAGYEQGFFIRSENFSFQPTFLLQFQNITSYGEDTKHGESSTDNGFEVHRMRLEFKGFAWDPKLTYDVSWTSLSDGSPFLENAFVAYEFAERFTIKAGQFKDHITQEEYMNDARLLGVERSMANEVLIGSEFDRVQGVALVYGDMDSALHIEGAYHDGAASLDTPFTDSATNAAITAYFGFSGRIDWKIKGNWNDSRDFTARDTSKDLLILGAGFDWTQGQYSVGTSAGGNRVQGGIDAQYELASARVGLYAAALVDYIHFNNSPFAHENLTNYGGVLQASWALTDAWEVFGRYDLVHMDKSFSATSTNTFHEFTIGVNYYLGTDGSAGHRAKFTVDAGYLPKGSPVALPQLGLPVESTNDLAYLRAQLQLAL